MRGAAFLLRGLYLVPVPVSFCLPDPRGRVPWHQARRDPTGLSPDPAETQDAVIQVFAAPAVVWRGLFSIHTWIAVKPTGAPRFTRYEVLGFGVANGAPAVRIDRMGPDNYWFGARPQILLDRRGPGIDETIAQVRAAVASYPSLARAQQQYLPRADRPPGPRLGDPTPVECGRQGFPAGRRFVRRHTQRVRVSTIALWALRYPARRPRGS